MKRKLAIEADSVSLTHLSNAEGSSRNSSLILALRFDFIGDNGSVLGILWVTPEKAFFRCGSGVFKLELDTTSVPLTDMYTKASSRYLLVKASPI